MIARCCRSEPRCRACPLLLRKDLRDLRQLGRPEGPADPPPHLHGLPMCLHKYGPLLARQLPDEQAASDERAG